MIKVLHVLAYEPIGGVGTFLKNTYQEMNPQKISFDFLVSPSDNKSTFSDTMTKMGCKIFLLSKIKSKNLFQYIYEVRKFYLEHGAEYDIVHVHSPNIAFIHFLFAKKYGIKTRIIHSHSTKYSFSKWKSIRNVLLIKPAILLATNYFAASTEAGRFLFPKKDFFVISNSVPTDIYKYNPKRREVIRNKLNIAPSKFVIGNVANFLPVKNHKYIIKIAQLLNDTPDIIFLLIGEGPLLKNIQRMALESGLTNIIFLGSRTDVAELYSAMDIFILPSLFEGFSLVALEAQVAGLPTVLSDKLPKEISLSAESNRIPIDDGSLSRWKRMILTYCGKENGRDKNFDAIKNSKYDSKISADLLLQEYERLRG